MAGSKRPFQISHPGSPSIPDDLRFDPEPGGLKNRLKGLLNIPSAEREETPILCKYAIAFRDPSRTGGVVIEERIKPRAFRTPVGLVFDTIRGVGEDRVDAAVRDLWNQVHAVPEIDLIEIHSPTPG
jgi:hypothetical protein